MPSIIRNYQVTVSSDDKGILIDEIVKAKSPRAALSIALKSHGYRAFVHKACYHDVHSKITGSVKSLESKRATCLHRYNIYWKEFY